MTTVVQIFAVNIVVFCNVPSGRLNRTYCASFFGWHKVGAYVCNTRCASAERIKFSVFFKRLSVVRFVKFRNVVVYCCVRVICVRLNIVYTVAVSNFGVLCYSFFFFGSGLLCTFIFTACRKHQNR